MATSSKKDPPATCIFISKSFTCMYLWDFQRKMSKHSWNFLHSVFESVQRRQNVHHAASLDLVLLVKDEPESSKEGAEDDPDQGGHQEEHHLKKHKTCDTDIFTRIKKPMIYCHRHGLCADPQLKRRPWKQFVLHPFCSHPLSMLPTFVWDFSTVQFVFLSMKT